MGTKGFAQRLWSLHQKGETQASFLKRIKVPQKTFYNWDRGKSSPTLKTVEKLARLLGVMENWLSYGMGQRDRPQGPNIKPTPDWNPVLLRLFNMTGTEYFKEISMESFEDLDWVRDSEISQRRVEDVVHWMVKKGYTPREIVYVISGNKMTETGAFRLLEDLEDQEEDEPPLPKARKPKVMAFLATAAGLLFLSAPLGEATSQRPRAETDWQASYRSAPEKIPVAYVGLRQRLQFNKRGGGVS